MKHLILLCAVLIPAILSYSCGNRQAKFEGTIIKEFPRVLELQDPVVIDESTEHNIIYLIDTLLLAQTHRNQRGSIFIYNILNKENLGPVTYRGRAANEFLYLDMEPWDFKLEPDGLKIWVYDLTAVRYAKINLTRRITENEFAIEEEHLLPEGTGNVMRISDSDFLLRMSSDGKKETVLYNIDSEEMSALDLRNSEKYKPEDEVKFTHAPYVIPSFDNNRKLLVNFAFQNRFKIVDMDTWEEKHISVYDGPVSPDGLSNDVHENITYYNYFAFSPEHIYGVYMKQKIYDILGDDPRPVKVHVYNIDGTPVACLKINEHVRYISVNEERNILIGITSEGTIYSYDISELLHS